MVQLCDAGSDGASRSAADWDAGVQVLVGNRRLLQEHNVHVSPAATDYVRHAEGRGHTCIYVASGGRCEACHCYDPRQDVTC